MNRSEPEAFRREILDRLEREAALAYSSVMSVLWGEIHVVRHEQRMARKARRQWDVTPQARSGDA